MVNEDLQKQKGQKNKGKISRCIFVAGCVITYFLIVGIIWSASEFHNAFSRMTEIKDMNNAKLVLYDGPTSLKDATAADLEKTSEDSRDITLKHCVDTQITVNDQDCYVYDTNVNNTHTWISTYTPALERTPVTYFDFEGTVEIKITVPDIDIENVTIRPLAYDIEPEIDADNHTVTFRVSDPDTYTVEFNDSVERAVHIFANELETDIPDFEDENVKYVGPGEWNIESIALEDNQTLYISGGAVVHGIVCANNAKNVTICGRGIIDGSGFAGWKGTSAQIPITFNNCQYMTVKDIISLNSNAWGLQAYDVIGGEIDGLKMITSRPNGDGLSLQSCKNVTVENCFIRTWDDSLVVKNYDVNSSKITFKNVQIWTDLAQSMEIGFETNKGSKENSTIEDITFEDITVLHNFHKPVLSIHNGDDAAISNVTYKNIVVEDASMGMGDGVNNLMDIEVLYNSGWSTTENRGTISNVVIDGFTVIDGNDTMPSIIQGFDAEHGIDGISISGFSIKGQDITSLEDADIQVDEDTVKNIEIK